jgi:hypothetical protein
MRKKRKTTPIFSSLLTQFLFYSSFFYLQQCLMKEQLILRNVLNECSAKSNQITGDYRREQRERAALKQKEAIEKRQKKNLATLKKYETILNTTLPSSEHIDEPLDVKATNDFRTALLSCTVVGGDIKGEENPVLTKAATTTTNNPDSSSSTTSTTSTTSATPPPPPPPPPPPKTPPHPQTMVAPPPPGVFQPREWEKK